MGWHHDAFCDWAPIVDWIRFACEGRCGTYLRIREDDAEGLKLPKICYRCQQGKTQPKPKPITQSVPTPKKEVA